MENVEYKGYTIEINQDEDVESPRDWDNLGKMVCNHGRYDLANEVKFDFDSCNSWQEVGEELKKAYAVVLPIFMYDHGSVSLSVTPYSCRWDSGQVGFVVCSTEDIKKEYSVKRISKKIIKKVESILINEVEIYSQYINGEVYRYSIDDENGETIDSCSGFYGYYFENNGLLESAKRAIDYHIEDIKKSHAKKLIAQIKHGVALEKREAIKI